MKNRVSEYDGAEFDDSVPRYTYIGNGLVFDNVLKKNINYESVLDDPLMLSDGITDAPKKKVAMPSVQKESVKSEPVKVVPVKISNK